MSSRLTRSIIRSAAVSLVACTAASAQVVDINGGNSWAGWNSVGNSQTSGIWTRGSTTRTFEIYSTSFVLSASQAVGGNNLAPASNFGANDGLLTFDVGDSSSYMATMRGNPRGQVRHYAVWNGFSQNGTPQEGNFTAPSTVNGVSMPSDGMPTRSFAILDNGSQTLLTSAQFFINIDATLRSNGEATFGDGDFGLNTRFGFWEGDPTAGRNGTQLTHQSFAFPPRTPSRCLASQASQAHVAVVDVHRLPRALVCGPTTIIGTRSGAGD